MSKGGGGEAEWTESGLDALLDVLDVDELKELEELEELDVLDVLDEPEEPEYEYELDEPSFPSKMHICS
jgi:hypothetical protein